MTETLDEFLNFMNYNNEQVIKIKTLNHISYFGKIKKIPNYLKTKKIIHKNINNKYIYVYLKGVE